VRSLHSPLCFGLLCGGASQNAHTWLIHNLGWCHPLWARHGGGRRRFRPTDPVGKNVKLWDARGIFVVWLISILVRIIKGVWLPTVRGEGAIMSSMLPAEGGVVMLSVNVRLGSHLCWLRPGSCG